MSEHEPADSASSHRIEAGDSILGSGAEPDSQGLFESERNRITAQVRPGTVFGGQFRLERLLGRGGMGVVYLATDTVLDKPVAIKLIVPSRLSNPQIVTRFLNEVRILQELSHENIVHAYSCLVDPATGLHYIVMEYVEGDALSEYMQKQGGRLSFVEMLDVVRQICGALSYAHPRLIHRDLKPQNIIRQHDGRVKVLDFGLAKFIDRTALTHSNAVVGTPLYLSPEQHADPRNVDHRTDLYALGLMIYEMLVGCVPQGRFEPASQAAPGIPKAVDRVIERCLAKREERYSSAAEVLHDLEPAAKGRRAKSARTVQGLGSAWSMSPLRSRQISCTLTIALTVAMAFVGVFAYGPAGYSPASPRPSGESRTGAPPLAANPVPRAEAAIDRLLSLRSPADAFPVTLSVSSRSVHFGDPIRYTLTSAVSGNVLLLTVDRGANITVLLPHLLIESNAVVPDQPRRLPSAMDDFDIQAGPPAGAVLTKAFVLTDVPEWLTAVADRAAPARFTAYEKGSDAEEFAAKLLEYLESSAARGTWAVAEVTQEYLP